jgi:hypothetical protein
LRAKFIYEAMRDILRPIDPSHLDPIHKEIYDVYRAIKDMGFNVKLESNPFNPNIKEITPSDNSYILSYLPEKEKDWIGIINGGGWVITNNDKGYLIIETIDKDKAIEVFVDLLENGMNAEGKYLS